MSSPAPEPLTVAYPLQVILQVYENLNRALLKVAELEEFKGKAVEYIRELEAREVAAPDEAPQALEGTEA